MVNSISSSSDYLAYLLAKIAESTSSSTTSTSTSTSTTSTSATSSSSALSASDIFAKLTDEVGGDGTSITKDQLEDYISTVESDTTGTYDKGSLGFLKQLDENWDSISDDEVLTEDELSAGMSYLKPPSAGSSGMSSDLFSALADAVDTDGDGISLTDLQTYLDGLISSDDSDSSSSSSDTDETTGSVSDTSNTELTNEVKFIESLIDEFNDFSDSSGTITSSSFYSAMQQPQDPSTITAEQLISPIDLKV